MTKSVGSKLQEFVQSYPKAPFDWEVHNCAHLVGNWIGFLSQGERYVVPPPFANKAAIRRFFVEHNTDLESLVTKYTSLQKIEPQYVTQGDIVLHKDPSQDFLALGIYVGPHTLLLGESGKIIFDILPIAAAWKINETPAQQA